MKLDRLSAKRHLFFLFVTCLLLASFTSRAGIVLDIPDVPGDTMSSDPALNEKIKVVRASGNFQVGGCGQIFVEKNLDIATPLLIRDTVNGTEYPEAVVRYFVVDEGSGIAQIFLELQLTNTRITTLSTEGVTDEQPVEQVSLSPEKIKVIYNTFSPGSGDPTGTIEETVECGKIAKKR